MFLFCFLCRFCIVFSDKYATVKSIKKTRSSNFSSLNAQPSFYMVLPRRPAVVFAPPLPHNTPSFFFFFFLFHDWQMLKKECVLKSWCWHMWLIYFFSREVWEQLGHSSPLQLLHQFIGLCWRIWSRLCQAQSQTRFVLWFVTLGPKCRCSKAKKQPFIGSCLGFTKALQWKKKTNTYHPILHGEPPLQGVQRAD